MSFSKMATSDVSDGIASWLYKNYRRAFLQIKERYAIEKCFIYMKFQIIPQTTVATVMIIEKVVKVLVICHKFRWWSTIRSLSFKFSQWQIQNFFYGLNGIGII